ncbi:MAG: aminodeoxychorismate/anthranilate synthase component II [Planctomycetaceae bacterium]|nr:aminodeoxychorismate/anthranilate synthase component II [Planctomycetaceae bacterium]
MLLLIDNYDSFVHTLAGYVRELGVETEVVRNDALSLDDITALKPQGILLSPGPKTPAESGICLDVIRHFQAEIPMLGVCLGHQALAAAFGGNVIRAPRPVHGMTSEIRHDATGIFHNCPTPFVATRYHSLIVEEASLPADLLITARSDDGLIMGLRHRTLPLYGVQFHPESILTQHGHQLLANFLTEAGASIPQDQLVKNHNNACHRLLASQCSTDDLPPDFFAAQIDDDAQRPI